MKRIISILILVFSATVWLGAQNASVQFKVSGFPKEATQVHLGHINGSKLVMDDTLALNKNGQINFDVNLKQPTLYILSFPGIEKRAIHLMLEPNDNISFEVHCCDSLNNLDITSAKGSRNIQVYKLFSDILYQHETQFVKINKEYSNPKTNENRKLELSMQFQQVQANQNIAVRKMIEQNTDALITAFLVTYFDNDIATYIDLFEAVENGLKAKYADNQFVQYVSTKVKSTLIAGREAPEIAMKDPDGKIRKLSDLRGNIVMIDFWASWCRPCRMENPNVVRLYHRYHKKGFEIYSVSLDKQRDQWLLAIEQDGLVWPNHVSDLNGWTSSGGASYGITSVPSTVLVDRQGRIIARNLRGQELENKLREIFGE